jgi:histone H3/H4
VFGTQWAVERLDIHISVGLLECCAVNQTLHLRVVRLLWPTQNCEEGIDNCLLLAGWYMYRLLTLNHRRLARRGGIKRISAMIYDDIRAVLKKRLELLLAQIVALVEHTGRKTVSVTDVIYTLNQVRTHNLYSFYLVYTANFVPVGSYALWLRPLIHRSA